MNESSTLYHKKDDDVASTKGMSQEDLFLYSIDYFHDSLEKRAKMGAQTALWTNRVIRSGILGLMLIAASILILVVVVSQQMTQIADVMLKMDQHMEQMVRDTQDMSHYVHTMGNSVSTLPAIVDEIAKMESTVDGMGNNIVVISEQMQNTSILVENIIGNVEGMDRNLQSVSHIVRGIDQSIDRVSRPFEMFNRMMPMP